MDKALEMLEALAVKLGATTEELIAIYAARAPAEWFDVWIWGSISVVALILLGLVIWACRDDHDGAPIAVLAAVLLICVAVTGMQASDAYKANAAPKAYALDNILNKLD